MNSSEKIDALAQALSAFQAEIKDPARDANNPFFKSKYVTLDDLLKQVRPVMAKHGLSFIQSPGGDGKTITIRTVLMHTSGQWIETEALALQAAKVDPQGAGSAVTYGRRYALSAVLGVAWDDDDDGNKASGHDGNKQANKTTQKSKRDEITEAIITAVKEAQMANEQVTELIREKFKREKMSELTDNECLQLLAFIHNRK